MVDIARPRTRLYWRRRRDFPWRSGEIKKLRHIHLRGISSRQTLKSKARLDQLQHRGVVGDGMGDVILFRKGGDHDQGNTIAGVIEVAGGSGFRGADVSRQKVRGRESIGVYRRLRRHVIIESAKLIPGQDEYRVRPRGTAHQCIDQACDVSGSLLYACSGDVFVYSGMFIEPVEIARIDY